MRHSVPDVHEKGLASRGGRLVRALLAASLPVWSAAPTLRDLWPARDARMVVGRQPFRASFSTPIRIGTGTITIRKSSDNSVVETIPVTSSTVSVGGVALLHGFEGSAEEFANGLGPGKRSRDTTRAHGGKASLSVTTDGDWNQAQTLYYPNGQDWSAMDSVVFWVYATASARVEPVTNSGTDFSWSVGRSAATLAANAWTRVSMPISGIPSPKFVQSFGFNLSPAGTYWFDDIALVKSGSDQLVFIPTTAFPRDNTFHVIISPGAVEELSSGDDFAGIQDATTWALRSDESPTGLQLSKTSIDENLPTGSTLGDFTTTDPDGGTEFGYSLVSGTGSTDNALFSIQGSSLRTAAILDYEVKPSLSIRVRTTDPQGGWFESVLPISVNNLPERNSWDVSTNAGIQAGGGNWGSDNFWTKNGTTLTAWPGGGNTAEFSGSDGTWTVNVNGTVQADSLVFIASGYTLNGGTLNLSGSAPTIVANANATVASNLAGGISKAGNGRLTLALSNSGMWSYTHKGGITLVKNTGGLGTGNVVMENGGRILLGSGTVFSNPLTISSCNAEVGNGALMPDSGASAEWSGPIAVNANCAYGGSIAGAAGNSGVLTLSGSLNLGGTATSIRHRSGTIVYKGGGGASSFELAEGTARLGAQNGLPPNAVWTQPHPSFTSVLELNGFNQVFQAIHAASNANTSVRNSSQTPSTLTLGGNLDTTFGGILAGNLSIAKSGSGRQTFSGANTFMGPLSVTGGTLRLGNPKALGDIAAGTSVSGNGSLDLAGQTVSDAEPLSLSGSGPSGGGALVNTGTSSAVFAGPLSLSGNTSITAGTGAIVLSSQTAVAGSGNNLALGGTAAGCRLDAGLATGTGGLSKTGSGQWILRGPSTYTGATSVASGTLCVAGSLAQSAVSVASGAVLCGNGTIGGPITAQGGTVAPGSLDTVGQMGAASLDLSRDSASTLRIRLKGTTKPGIQYDRLSLSGALVLGGKSVLDLDLAGLSETGTAGGVAVAGSISGQFSTVRTRNNPNKLDVSVTYSSSQVNVVVTRKAPSFSKGSSPVVREDSGPASIPGWASAISGGSAADGAALGFRLDADRPSLFSTQPSVSATGTLTFAPRADSNGTAKVRIRLGASGNPDSSAVDSFTITVSPVNDPPRFAKGADPTAASDSTERVHSGWARSISAGPPDESGQKLAFRIAHTSSALYAVQPTLAPDGTLRFTPKRGVNGTDTLYVRLGDDGGTSDGGIDSSGIDTFHIALRSLALEIRPSTLKLLLGDTARFQAVLTRSDGTDTVVPGSAADWSWSSDLGDFAGGRVLGRRTGTSRIFVRYQGSMDSALLWVSELDTVLAPSTDSVSVRAGHGIQVVVPAHGANLGVSVVVRDSSLAPQGIAGADSAMVVSVNGPDTVRIKAPLSLIPDSKRRTGSDPSVYWMDSDGRIHLAASTRSGDAMVFSAFGVRAWWLGWDTLAPTVWAIHSTDSMGSVPVLVRWGVRDNIISTIRRLCLQKAGQAPACRSLAATTADTGVVLVSRQDLPLGGRYWVEAGDGNALARTDTSDIVVRLDSLACPWSRTEDRYELLSLPYVQGTGSAHATFRAQWGEDDPRKWRVFAADSGRLEDLLEGDAMDAWGRSFWVRTRGLALTPWIARRWTSPMSQELRIRLEPGWNAVGNPLGFDLSWRQIWRNSAGDSANLSGPFLFDGPSQGWSIPDTTLRWGAWRGAAILNRSTKPVDLGISSIPDGATGSGAGRTRSAPSTPILRIGIQASQGEGTAAQVWMGLDRTHRTWELPPAPRSSLVASLRDPSAPATALLSDVRLPADTATTWTVRVQGLVPRRTLVLQSLRTGSDTLREAWIHDDKSDRWLPLAPRSEWAVGDEEERTFQILAGRSPVPKGPRPFTVGIRGAALAWSLPDRLGRCRVRIEAFDPLGRRLGGLVDEEMDPGSYGRPLRLASPTGQVLLVLSAGEERISSRWLLRR